MSRNETMDEINKSGGWVAGMGRSGINEGIND